TSPSWPSWSRAGHGSSWPASSPSWTPAGDPGPGRLGPGWARGGWGRGRGGAGPAGSGLGGGGFGLGSDQGRLFELLLVLLERLGAERPAVLVVEDLHWADRSTRDLLAFLPRER